MSMYRVKEHRVDAARGSEIKSLVLGWDVIEYGAEQRTINTHPLPQQEARELAAAYEWMWHLDKWMVTVVEDEDAVEEIGDILGLPDNADSISDEEIQQAWDKMTVESLKFLPAGLRLLADIYEKEWKSKHAAAV